ncbi:V-type proton ATPase subunit d2 [Glycine soja]
MIKFPEGGGGSDLLFCLVPFLPSTNFEIRNRHQIRSEMYGFEALTFNIHGGFLEAIVRGHRAGLLTTADYNNLCQCETLDDIKMHLSATEYGPYLQNEPSPLHTTTIVEKCTLKLVDDYKNMLCQATEPLSTFLEYITYGHMIDNVVLIVTGTLHERDVQELLEKCHPLGMFDSIATLAVAQNMRELYRLVLVDTPLAPYFSECITSEDLDDMNIEIMRNTLYKAYLEDFYRFCQKLGGATAEIMSDLLAFEADRRAVNITINSIGTELTRDDRRKLYSNFGLLYPYGHEELAVCEDIDQVRAVMEKYPPYQSIFAKLSYGESQMLDKAFYEEEVKRLCLAFEQQFHYAVFFAYMRLREQEIRNLMWISECVAQNQKCHEDESYALSQFKERFVISKSASYNPFSYSKIASWNATTDFCSWDGIECDHHTAHVIAIDLSSSQIFGTMDANSSLFHLKHLQSLEHFTYFPNFLRGLLSCHSFICQTIISIHSPVGCGEKQVFVSHNSLVGKISPLICNLKSLVHLDLSFNNLSGMVPSCLGNHSSQFLQFLVLKGNQLIGPIPQTYTITNALRIIDLSNNNLPGQLPRALVNCRMLEFAFKKILNWVSMKASKSQLQFEPYPPYNLLGSFSWASEETLIHLQCFNKGTIMVYEKLQDLSGKIPQQLEELTFLSYLNVSLNNLSGPIPQNKQFATFEGCSFEGNQGLCGNQLFKKCEDDAGSPFAPPSATEDDHDSGFYIEFDWRVVLIGYGVDFDNAKFRFN